MEALNDVISQINHIKDKSITSITHKSIKTGIEGEAQSLLFPKLFEIIELQQRKRAIYCAMSNKR